MSGLLNPLRTASQMICGFKLRTGLMIFQFTVGMSALLILLALISISSLMINTLQAMFGSQAVLAITPKGSGIRSSAPALADKDIPDLQAIDGVSDVAILWSSYFEVGDQGQIKVYILNEAFERLVDVTVDGKPDARIAGSNSVFLTKQAKNQLFPQKLENQTTLELRWYNHTYMVNVGGVVKSPLAFPTQMHPFIDFAWDEAAILFDYNFFRENIQNLGNATWLVLEENADETAVIEQLNNWYRVNHLDGRSLVTTSIQNDIVRHKKNMVTSPGTWISGIAALVLLLMAGLGFAGQTMYLTETRKAEWALRLALGATRTQVIWQLFVEIAFVVLVASVLSLLGTMPIISIITQGKGVANYGPVLLTISIVAFVLTCGVSVYPLRKVSQQEPAAILKETW